MQIRTAIATHKDIKDLAWIILERSPKEHVVERYVRFMDQQGELGTLVDLYINAFVDSADEGQKKISTDTLDQRVSGALTVGNDDTPHTLSPGMIAAWRKAGREIGGAVLEAATVIYPEHELWEAVRYSQKPT